MRTSHVPKDVSEYDSALSLFESLILPFVNTKLFQIRLLKCVLKREKRGVLDRDPRRKPDSRTKLFRNMIRACAFWKCRWSHAWVNQRGLRSGNKILPRSAQILIVIGKAFAMHVNARSSNHEPNHEADRDPKRLSECDSFLCEHSHKHTCPSEGTLCSARRIHRSFDTYFNLSPIYHLYVLFVEISYQTRFVFKVISCNFIYNANRIFIVYILLPGTSKAFTLSIFCCAHIHALLQSIQFMVIIKV